MEKITYTNSLGETITFDGPPFYLQSITGLGDVTANLQLQKSAYQNGSRLVGTQLDEREINVSFVIVADDEEDVITDLSRKRSKVASVLNPLLGAGTLEYQRGNIVRQIKCIADSVPIYPDSSKRSQRMQAGSVMFVAPRPHWLSKTHTGVAIATAMFAFPFEGDFEFGMQRDEFYAFNNGDAETPLRFDIFGPIDNPMILNKTTGKHIKLNLTVDENEKLTIDTDTDELRVELTDAEGVTHDVLHKITFDSTLSGFTLAVGPNEIIYTADTAIQYVNIEMMFTVRYNAV